jgi:hypothetical protein
MAIKAERAEEVRRLVDWHGPDGTNLLTLTIPHGIGNNLRASREAVSLAYRLMISGAPWERMMKRFGLVGAVRAIEVTHGPNGWHPHIHALLLLRPLSTAEREELRRWIARRWIEKVKKVLGQGVAPSIEHGCDLRPCRRSDYLAKLSLELTAPRGKEARHGNRSPLQIALDFLATGDEADLELWQAYTAGMRGARMLTWSRGVRAAAGLTEEEKTDEEIVEGENGDETVVAVIAGTDWDDVRDRPNAKLALLSAAEDGGANAVRSVLVALLGREPTIPASLQESPAFSGGG